MIRTVGANVNMKSTHLPKPSALSKGARWRVDMAFGPNCGIYLTREDAETVAREYRGKVVEVDESGIAL